MTLKEKALNYHQNPRPGKLATKITKPLKCREDFGLAYTPGVAEPCKEIHADNETAFLYTNKGNSVAVISNGTAVLGLGDIGAIAGKPVMEGKSLLFKYLGGIDSVDIEVNEKDPEKLAEFVRQISCTFGGINLEDVSAPSCFKVSEAVTSSLGIPYLHDDQHGTAIVVISAILSGLKLIGKNLDSVKIVFSGAGAAAIACAKIIKYMGAKTENIYMFDSVGLIHNGRTLDQYKSEFSQVSDCTLPEALVDADIFVGLSKGGIINKDHIAKMAPNPIILAMANPVPEILPTQVKEARPDAIVGSGRSDYENQVNNVLCFPFLFRGALDTQAKEITMNMKTACASAIMETAQKHPNFDRAHIIPDAFDPTLIYNASLAVAKAAIADKVAQKALPDDYFKYLDSMLYGYSFDKNEVEIPQISDEIGKNLVRILEIHQVTKKSTKILKALDSAEMAEKIKNLESGIFVFDDVKIGYNCGDCEVNCTNLAKIETLISTKNFIGIISGNDLFFNKEMRVWFAHELCK